MYWSLGAFDSITFTRIVAVRNSVKVYTNLQIIKHMFKGQCECVEEVNANITSVLLLGNTFGQECTDSSN